ncbi:hypothetical protein SLEP1_g19956 [Rubroshorea leprosula]|uniref:Uncharacterized protein n=1 Tax=Rubroshorea leprosula TaxID=152421 RepID=A0AAV5J117_9ROSI|nr:hypothetical protein SLEP1_g19956 [Rubroshorea leprosula]
MLKYCYIEGCVSSGPIYSLNKYTGIVCILNYMRHLIFCDME